MKNIFNYFKESTNNIYKILAILLIALGIIARLYNYIWHKDLWLDETSLALSMHAIPFSEVFFKPLQWGQAAPLGFLAFTKLLCVVFGYSEHVLYFLPLICGIGTLILSFLIGKRLFDGFGTLAFVALVVGSMGLLHYSTEFKQYGIEAFIGFLLFYLYIRNTSLCVFSIVASICILFSNTAIFLIIPLLMIYISSSNAKSSPNNPQNPQRLRLKATFQYCLKNFFYLALPLIVFIIYYFLYIKFQATDHFYRYWQKAFLPHDIREYPNFIKEIWLGVYQSYTPFLTTNAVKFYVFAFILGLFALYKQRKDIFYICILSFFIYLALSWFEIYPFGLSGFLEGRLSLFMSVTFYISICYFLYALHLSKKFYTRIIANLLLATITIAAFIAYKKPIIKHQFFIYQQTHAHITNIANNIAPNDKIFIFFYSEPAFLYYTYLENVKLPYKRLVHELDIESFRSELQADFDGGANIWILANHHPIDWQENLIAMVERAFSGVADLSIDTKDGAMFIKIAH